MIDLKDYTARKKRWLKYEKMVCVYAIGPEKKGPTKIGFAAEFCTRFGGIQSSNWVKVYPFSALWCVGLPVAERVERATHERLQYCRIIGEWFDIDSDKAAKITRETAESLYPSIKFRDHDEIVNYMDEKGAENLALSYIDPLANRAARW